MAGTVLVVDAHPDAAGRVRAELGPEWNVIGAADGREALAIVREAPGPRRIAFVLLDADAPVMDGVDVLLWLRSDAATADLPVVMLTGRGTVHQIALALSLGADGCLPKPFDAGDVAVLVRRHVAARPTRDSIRHVAQARD
jgi:two-component system, OmpR family, response regulator